MSPGASRGGPRCEEQDGDGGVEVLAAPAMRLLLPERCKHVVPINDGLVLAGGHPKVYHMDLTTSEVMEVDTLGDDIVDMCHVSGSGHLVAMVGTYTQGQTRFERVSVVNCRPPPPRDSRSPPRQALFAHSFRGCSVTSVLALDSNRVMVGCDDEMVRVFTVALRGPESLVQKFKHPRDARYDAHNLDSVTALAVDPNRCFVVSGADSGSVHCWHWKTLKHSEVLAELGCRISAISVSPEFICVASIEEEIRLYSRSDHSHGPVIIPTHSWVCSISLHPVLPVVVVGGLEGTLRAFDVVSRRKVWDGNLLDKGMQQCEPGNVAILPSGHIATTVLANARKKRTANGEGKGRHELLIFDRPMCFDVGRWSKNTRGGLQYAPPILVPDDPFLPHQDLIPTAKRRRSAVASAATLGVPCTPSLPPLGAPYTPGDDGESVPLGERGSSDSTRLSGFTDLQREGGGHDPNAEIENGTDAERLDLTGDEGPVESIHAKPQSDIEAEAEETSGKGGASPHRQESSDSMGAEAQPNNQHGGEVDACCPGAEEMCDEPCVKAVAPAKQPSESQVTAEAELNSGAAPPGNVVALTATGMAAVSEPASLKQDTEEAMTDGDGDDLAAPVDAERPGNPTAEMMAFTDVRPVVARRLRLPHLASAMAAFVVDWDPERITEFDLLRKTIQISFMKRGIGPSSLMSPHGIPEKTVVEFVREEMTDEMWRIGYGAGM